MKLLICAQVLDKNHPILGFFHRWVAEFADHFDEVHVICLQKGVSELPPYVFVYSLGKEEGENNLKYLLRFYRYFFHIFFRVRIDFVFFHMGAIFNVLASPFFLLRKMYGTKFYWWKAHGHINWFGRFALHFVDRVYTSTETGFPIDTKKRHVIGQAIDIARFVFDEGKKRTKEMIYVGRIVPIKRLEDFIEVAERVFKKDTNYRFTIIGPHDDAQYLEKLMQLTQQKGMAGVIQFIGGKKQEELVPMYQNATIFLNTSLTHSMDKTVLEAMLCGCLPVTANHAFHDLLTQEGLYVNDAHVDGYAEVVLHLVSLEDDSSLRARMREAVVVAHSLETFPSRIFNV